MTDRYTDTTCQDPRDWRGVPIVVGNTCIYGAPVGRSIAMVEARVVGFTKSGWVNVEPIRRAYGAGADWGSADKKVVHVGQDRLTIIETLPPALLPTDDERRATVERVAAARKAAEATHTWPLHDANAEDRERYRRNYERRPAIRDRGAFGVQRAEWDTPEEMYPVHMRTDHDAPCERGCGITFRQVTNDNPVHCTGTLDKSPESPVTSHETTV